MKSKDYLYKIYMGENAIWVQFHTALQILNFTCTTGQHFNQKCMMIFLLVRNYGKLSAEFLLGTSAVIEKVGLLSYFDFFARTIIKIRLNTFILSILFPYFDIQVCVLEYLNKQ